jgi:hypothetical protein
MVGDEKSLRFAFRVVVGNHFAGLQVLSVLNLNVEVFWCLCPWPLLWVAQLRQPFSPQRVRLSQLNGRLNVVDGYCKWLVATPSYNASAAVLRVVAETGARCSGLQDGLPYTLARLANCKIAAAARSVVDRLLH